MGVNSFPVILRRASLTMLFPAMLPHGEATHCDDLLSVMGLISTPGAALTPPANMRSKTGLTRIRMGYGTGIKLSLMKTETRFVPVYG